MLPSPAPHEAALHEAHALEVLAVALAEAHVLDLVLYDAVASAQEAALQEEHALDAVDLRADHTLEALAPTKPSPSSKPS